MSTIPEIFTVEESALPSAVITMNESEDASQSVPTPRVTLPARRAATGSLRAYVRIAALGDSATYGIGDRADGQWRGWAALLAAAIGERHDVSFCNLARPGATVVDVCREQMTEAVSHGPQLASLLVGINDTLRSSWDPELARLQLLSCAAQLTRQGALLLTVAFHDHAEVLPLPRPLRTRLSVRVDALNAIYEEVHARFGGIQVDLRAFDEPLQHDFWSVDRMHPSELGHRWLARQFAERLNVDGLDFEPPAAVCSSHHPSRRENVHWLITQGGPWLGRRALDFGPWAARETVLRARLRHA